MRHRPMTPLLCHQETVSPPQTVVRECRVPGRLGPGWWHEAPFLHLERVYEWRLRLWGSCKVSSVLTVLGL